MKNVCKERIVLKMKTSQIMCTVPTSLLHQDIQSLISRHNVRIEHYLLLNLSFLILN